MLVTAEETYTTNPPSLMWNARFKVAGLPILRTKDKYESGYGHMFGKLIGVFTVFDVSGEKLDQATMIGYLNEIMWFPTAFLGEHISWEDVDEHSAQVTFSDHGKSVSARMFFDDVGRLTRAQADPVSPRRYAARKVQFDQGENNVWSKTAKPLSKPLCGVGVSYRSYGGSRLCRIQS
jgi:hypothetical protein